MKRKLEEYLCQWRDLGVEKMPLLLYGARQIGKTFLLREFGANNYKNTAYLNFETEPALSHIFSDSIDPKKLLPKIERFLNTRISPKDTLIIFDEIQSCNRALTSLKYFCEEAPEYDLIGAGSLLGIHTSSENYSFPVGKVITKMMYPMSFEEFLWASDWAVFADRIRECFFNDTPIDQALHESLMNLYREYLFVGGMPLAVNNYFNSDRIINYTEIQRIILDTYVSDMTKYADRAQSLKTISTYDSIVPQLAKDNRKFQYKHIAKGARASLFGESIDWLIRAGVVHKCARISSGDMPPEITVDLSAFKLYMSDIGIASFKAGLTRENLRIFDNTFMGGITENYVAISLACTDHALYYWESDSKAEVDFVIMTSGKLIPLEVKANVHSRSYSLNSYMKKYGPEYAIRVSGKNFGFENGIKSVPLYAAYLIL
ncbi:MAG: ATP-binding protein [Oscillospiraceae bacterium]|nr:ATP-binding protein [Oscillospiraceae bacterium]